MRIFIVLFAFLLLSCSEKPIAKKTVVGIIPYKGISSEKVAMLRNSIQEYYGISTKLLPEMALPRQAFINIKSPRYRADSLIAIQQSNMPEGVDYILGLTEIDISVTKKDDDGKVKEPEWKYNDFGIMGLAYCPGKSCAVSGFRLKHKDKEVHFGRFKKVVIHELGHNFGLPHCPDKKCVMTDAVEKIKTIDDARPELCNKCKSKIGIVLGINVTIADTEKSNKKNAPAIAGASNQQNQCYFPTTSLCVSVALSETMRIT